MEDEMDLLHVDIHVFPVPFAEDAASSIICILALISEVM